MKKLFLLMFLAMIFLVGCDRDQNQNYRSENDQRPDVIFIEVTSI